MLFNSFKKPLVIWFTGLLSIIGVVFGLLSTVFFSSMAITIMAGLGFATILTLIVVPVMYAILFKIKLAPNHA